MLWLWLAILLMMGLLFGMAYQRFNSDTLVDGLRKELRRIYPHSKIHIGEAKTQFLVDLNVKINELLVENEGHKELQVNHLELKIPWWTLLSESGRVQLNIEGLLLNLPHKKGSAPNQQSDKVLTFDLATPQTIQLSLPKYVIDSALNIRIKDLELIDPEQGERRLKLSKVIIRDYKVGEKTAFELNIPLSIKWGGSYTGEIWVFGDFLATKQMIQTNWRADARGFKQEDWNLNDLFLEGQGTWNYQDRNLESQIALIHSSKKISELSIKISKENLSLSGPINQLPLDIIKPLVKQFHPRKELSYFIGSELATGHFAWTYTWPGVKHHFDLRLGFEGEFYKDQGVWGLQWASEAYNLDFTSLDKKTKFSGLWSPQGIHHKLDLDNKSIHSADLITFDPLFVYVFSTPEQKLDIKLNQVLWKDKLYSGSLSFLKRPIEKSKAYEMRLTHEKAKFDYNWTLSATGDQKLDIKSSDFILGPFGTYFHESLNDSMAKINGKIDMSWNEDPFLGKGSSNLSISQFSDRNPSWNKYWDLVAQRFSIAAKPEEIGLQMDWKNGNLKLKKLTANGPQIKSLFTGKLDFTGKKSEIIQQDQLSNGKKTTQSFIINEFVRTL